MIAAVRHLGIAFALAGAVLFKGDSVRELCPGWLYIQGQAVSGCRMKRYAQVPLAHVAGAGCQPPWHDVLCCVGENYSCELGSQFTKRTVFVIFQGLMQCHSAVCIFVNYHMMNTGPYYSKPFLLTKCCAYSQFSLASVFVNFTLKDQHAQDARVHPSLSLSKEISAFLSPQVI